MLTAVWLVERWRGGECCGETGCSGGEHHRAASGPQWRRLYEYSANSVCGVSRGSDSTLQRATHWGNIHEHPRNSRSRQLVPTDETACGTLWQKPTRLIRIIVNYFVK